MCVSVWLYVKSLVFSFVFCYLSTFHSYHCPPQKPYWYSSSTYCPRHFYSERVEPTFPLRSLHPSTSSLQVSARPHPQRPNKKLLLGELDSQTGNKFGDSPYSSCWGTVWRPSKLQVWQTHAGGLGLVPRSLFSWWFSLWKSQWSRLVDAVGLPAESLRSHSVIF